MEYISGYRLPKYITAFNPGEVGPVGDIFTSKQLRTTGIYDTPRIREGTGTKIRDGYRGGKVGQPVVRKRAIPAKIVYARKYQETTDPAKTIIPTFVSGTSDYHIKRAQVYSQDRVDTRFLPLPGGYGPRPGDLQTANAPRQTAVGGGGIEGQVDYIGSGNMPLETNDYNRARAIGFGGNNLQPRGFNV